jgi:hypothetical protein
MPESTLIDLPSASTTIAAAGAWSSPIFDNFFPIAIVEVGIFVGVAVVVFLIGSMSGAFGWLAGRFGGAKAGKYD